MMSSHQIISRILINKRLKEIIIPTGEKIILRSAKKEDAESVCAHKYITSEESYYMARYPEECEHDVSAIETRLSDIEKHPQNFSVTAFKDGKVIGDLGVTQIRNHIKFRHRAYMGISIQKKYWNCGLGSQMVDIAVKQAKENGEGEGVKLIQDYNQLYLQIHIWCLDE